MQYVGKRRSSVNRVETPSYVAILITTACKKFIQTHSYLENNLASSRRATTPLPLSSAPKERLYKNTNVVHWPLHTGHD